ncbi:hypothetical protein NSS71_08115 [Niallia sp. FSL W8-0951]|uniref:hypothetical protein n=1 Tax=Niallia sp. FSL W8-0951 TaxID=2954639 RepID=UPI0030F99EDA
MLFWGAAVIIGIYLIYGIIEYINWGGFDEIIEAFIGGALLSLLYCVILFVIVMFLPYTYTQSHSFEIYALKDNSSINGRFFLGTGNVDGNQVYSFIKKEDGGKKVSSISVDSAIVYEGENESPRIDAYDPHIKSKIARKLFGDMAFGDSKYKIYIPDNSMINEYKVDME